MRAASAQEIPAGRRPRSRAARVLPSAFGGAVLLGSLIWLAWQAGGYFPPDYLLVGAIVLAAGGAILLAQAPRHRLSTEALVGLGALAAFAGWTGLSAWWSPTPDSALEAMQRSIVHAGIFGVALIATGSGRYSKHLVWAVLAAICVVVGASLISRLYPDIISENRPELGSYRLAYPWTYWNAAGAAAAMGAVLAFGVAADPRSRVSLRAVTGSAVVPLVVAMYLSLSRGAWLALIAGLVILVLLSAHRGSLLVTALTVGAGSSLALVLLTRYPALTTDPSVGIGQSRSGREYAAQLVLIIAATLAAQWAVAAGRASKAVMGPLRRVARPAGVTLAGLAVLFAIVTYVVRAGEIEGWTAERGHDFGDWVSIQWDDFMRSAAIPPEGTARLTSAKGSRSESFGIALDAFWENPFLGEGAGSYEARWIRDRSLEGYQRNAHSLEFETLGELGLVGFALLMTFLGSVTVAAVRSSRRPRALPRSTAAAAGATCAVWIVHSAADWDWQMSALTGLMLALAAALYPEGRRGDLAHERAA